MSAALQGQRIPLIFLGVLIRASSSRPVTEVPRRSSNLSYSVRGSLVKIAHLLNRAAPRGVLDRFPIKANQKEAAAFGLNWVSATGPGILFSAIFAGLVMGVPGAQSIVIASTTTQWYGQEIFCVTFSGTAWLLAALAGMCVDLLASVSPFTQLVVH